jgi:hypothetical protein
VVNTNLMYTLGGYPMSGGFGAFTPEVHEVKSALMAVKRAVIDTQPVRVWIQGTALPSTSSAPPRECRT